MAGGTRESSASVATEPSRGGIRGIYYGYWLAAAGFITQFISVGAQNYIIGAFLKPMTDDLDWSRTEFTFARTIGQFVMAVTGLMIGAHVDRHGGRRLMQVGITILALSLFACSFVQTLWQWWLLNGLMLTTGAAMIGNLVVNVTLAKWFVEQRGRVIGFASMGVSFGGIALTPLATGLVEWMDWRDAWRVLAIGAFAIIFPITFLMRRAPEDYGLHPDGRSAEEVASGRGEAAAADFASSITRHEAMRSTAFYLVAISFGLGILNISMMLVQTIPFMTDAGYSAGVGALMILMISIPAVALKPVWGFIIDKGDVKRLGIVGFILNGVGLFLIVLSVRAGIEPLIYLSFFVLGCGWSGFIPLQEVVWASFFGRRYLGEVRSAGLPFAFGLSASAPLLSSAYHDAFGNYDGAFITVGVLTLLGGALFLTARQPARVARP